MTAGSSAELEARRYLANAEAHEAAALEARAAAARYNIASVTEKRTMQVLTPLASLGVTFLADRRWPGSRTAQVDLITVGPQGVFIVDTKAWKDVHIADGRIFRGDADVTEDLLRLSDLVDTAEADFAEIGLAPGEVHAVAVLAGHGGINARVGIVDIVGEQDILRYIASRGTRLTASQVDAVLAQALTTFPLLSSPAPASALLPEPVVEAPPEPTEDALISTEEVEAAILEGVLAQPIEEWMSFLHPDQAKLVRRSFGGPARIRGAAGTGKTVVGLHRAAYLARTRPGRILVTTFVRTLPTVLEHHLARMAPEVADRVEFTGVHQFAKAVLDARGVRVDLDGKKSDAAFSSAWQRVPAKSPLRLKGLTKRYWDEEVRTVIKGRGITDFDAYAELTRTGRGYRLGIEQRRAVWELYVDYTKELRALGTHDFADVILLAERELAARPLETAYAAVIVDEAQDLSCAMVRMLYGLVGDAPDGFTLIGDGQQSIYPGGYTLAEAGISVANRGVVMDVNYRNTAQILEFAHEVVAGSEFADIEGEVAKGERPAHVPRVGPEPVIAECVSRADHDRQLMARVREVQRDVATGWGDIGVLASSSWEARRVEQLLRAAGLPVVWLQDYDGAVVDAVKVGTIKRAKGLEFKQVCLASVKGSALEAGAVPEDGAECERWELERRELFVGMTRARDGLWVGAQYVA